jgi:uncharacterized protein (TIGR02996 family)
MHTLLGSTGGKQFWDDHVKAQPHRGAYDWSTLEHAVFDMDDPVAHDMLDEHKKLMYTKKQAPKPQTGTGNAPTTYSCRNSPHTGLPEGKSHSDDRRGNGNGRRQSPAEGTSGEVHTGDAFGQAFAEVLIRYSVEPTHADFHKAIHNEPEAMHHHLVYADWLQEQGVYIGARAAMLLPENGNFGIAQAAFHQPDVAGPDLLDVVDRRAVELHVLKAFRQNCRILVAVGACAITGGVPAMRNSGR